MTYSPQFNSIIQQSKDLYYAGKHQEALTLLDQTIQLIESQEEKLSEDGSDLVIISQRLEYTSLYFAVQSLFLHNLDVSSTVKLLKHKLESIDPITSFYSDLKDLLGLALYYGEMVKQEKNLKAAKKHFLEVYHYRKNTKSEEIGLSHFHLGLVYQYSDNTTEALDHFIEADEIAKQENNYYLRSFSSRHLGFLYQQTGEIGKATELFELSLKLRLDNNILVYVPFSCISLADSYIKQNKDDRALQLYHQAINIAEMIKLNRALTLGHLSLARYNQSQGNNSPALKSYLDSYYYARIIDHEGIIGYVLSQLKLNSIDQSV